MHTAVATAFTHQLIDNHALGRVYQAAAFAPAAFLGSAGLVVNDDGGAFDLAKLALNTVKLVAVLHAHAVGQLHPFVFIRLVGHHNDLNRAFGTHALGNLHHGMAFRALPHLLAAGHGDGVVVENFVGDVDPRSNALAHRQHAAVEVGAIAQVGEHVLVVAERLLPHPGHAFAAHLREAHRSAVHPDGHEVAANAGHGARALGHFGGGVVRAARAKPGLPISLNFKHLHDRFLGVQDRQVGVEPGLRVGVHPELFQALGNGACNQRRRQVGVGAQQRVGGGVGHGPFAPAETALSLAVRELAQHIGTHVRAPVVQLFFHLVFNDLAFFFHHQNLL